MISLIGGQPARDQAIVTSNGVRLLSGREGRLGRNLVTDYPLVIYMTLLLKMVHV